MRQDSSVDDTGRRRRDVLRTLGAGAVMSGLAGCAGTLGEETEIAPEDTETTATPATATSTESEPVGGTAGLEPCVLSPPGGDPEEFEGDVTSDTTLGADASYYLITDDIEVSSGATLTVEPGTYLSFTQDARLDIVEDAALSAIGTCEEPIYFTGEQQTRGFWRGIEFDETDRTPSRLEYCVVEYGGSDTYSWVRGGGNIGVSRGARVAINNSTLRESGAWGMTLGNGVTVEEFSNNVVTSSEYGAAALWPNVVQYMDASSSYTGNDYEYLRIRDVSSNTRQLYEDQTWENLDAAYQFADEARVQVLGHLTIEPGTTLVMGQDSSLVVDTDEDQTGSLTAVGMDPETEEVREITFTGEQQTRGYWQGIEFDQTDRTENNLRNCVIEYGGRDNFNNVREAANVAVSRGSRVRIANCTLRESAGYGITWTGSAIMEGFDGNEVTSNEDAPIAVSPHTTHFVQATGSYTGNGDDYVFIRDVASNAAQVNDEMTWENVGVPFRLAPDGEISVTGHLTVEPGTTVEFGQASRMEMITEFGSTGRLTAVGTADEPIQFVGEQQTQGYWMGLYFDETDRTENQLIHCVVGEGGRDNYTWINDAANVTVTRGSRLTIEDTTLRNSAGYGVAAAGNSIVNQANLSFDNNALGGVL